MSGDDVPTPTTAVDGDGAAATPPTPVTAPTPTPAAADGDADLDGEDALLGATFRGALGPHAVRGMGLVALALAILLWPSRSDRVLAVLVGIGLAGVTAWLVVSLGRHAERRTFPAVVGLAFAGGMSASLLAHPDESLVSVVQLGGASLIALGVVELVRAVRARDVEGWPVAKAVAGAAGGALLLAYPASLLRALTAVGAAVVGAAGLIQVLHRPDPDEGPAPTGIGPTLLGWVRRRPDMSEDRSVLREKVFFEGPDAPARFARFCALMGFAAVIAATGVTVRSTAVVIGAMLVAPLMTPLMGTALAVPMGWPRRMRRCMGVALVGVGIGVLTGALVGALAPGTLDVVANAEIASRISPTAVDLAIAVAAGAAGAYALSRRDVSDSLPGVAVAIALVPPLVVVGLCWQQQEWTAGYGALLLFATNAIAILVAGGSTFVLVGAAPLDRVSQGQARLRTATLSILTVAAVVVLLLLVNGQALTRAELARDEVDRALTAWSEEHDGYEVVDQQVRSDGTLQVDLAGPGEPPALDALLADLEEALGGDVVLDVRWIEQQQVVVGGS